MNKIIKKIQSIFRETQNTPESFFTMVESKRWKDFIGKDEIRMIQGVIEVSELQVRDIMIPRSNMIVLEESNNVGELLKKIVGSGHSRFPVIADNKDEVLGILLAKDILKFTNEKDSEFIMSDYLRSPTFIPESKRLKILLKEFRKSRNHMAIVVDEYGRTAGMLTIEDVLEQIVGDIEDEFDAEDLPMIKELQKGIFQVDALIRMEDFNDAFESEFDDEDFDTLGGMLSKNLGRLPIAGEKIGIGSFLFQIREANQRKIILIEVKKID
jgi:magnesium and cobalt transporter